MPQCEPLSTLKLGYSMVPRNIGIFLFTYACLCVDIFGHEISLQILDLKLHEIRPNRWLVDKDFAADADTTPGTAATSTVAAKATAAYTALTLKMKKKMLYIKVFFKEIGYLRPSYLPFY